MHLSKHKAFLEFIYIFDLHIYSSSTTLCFCTTEFQLWLSALFTSLIVLSLHKSESFKLVSMGFLCFLEMVTRYFKSSQPLIHVSQHHYHLPNKVHYKYNSHLPVLTSRTSPGIQKKAETFHFCNVFTTPAFRILIRKDSVGQ